MKSPLVLVRWLLALGLLVPVLRAADAAPQKNGYTVLVDIKVDEKGEPQSASLVQNEDTSPGDVLAKMAIAMALKTKFPPRLKDGNPVKFTARAPFFFPVEDDEGSAADAVPKPKVKDAIQPVYPLDLRASGVTGGAILELHVDAVGKLAELKTLRASHPEFEAAARDAVSKWTFTPAQKDNQPVASRSRLAIVFETEAEMADLKWRIPPRPKLGSLTVIRPDHPIDEAGNPIAAPAGAAPAPAAPTTEPAPATK